MDRVFSGARVVRVIDADTVVLDVDLGFGVWMRGQSFRLHGCNAREKSMAGGPEAIENLRQLLSVGMEVSLTSVKPDKFGGRYDARIFLSDGTDVTTLLVNTGWAAPWDGRGTRPVPAWPRVTS